MTAEPEAEPKQDKPARGDERSQLVQWLFGKDSTTVTLFVALAMIGYDKAVLQPNRDKAIEEQHTKQIMTVAEKFDRDQERDDDWLKSIMFNRQAQAQTQSMNIGAPDQEKLIREAQQQIIAEMFNGNVHGTVSAEGSKVGGEGGEAGAEVECPSEHPELPESNQRVADSDDPGSG